MKYLLLVLLLTLSLTAGTSSPVAYLKEVPRPPDSDLGDKYLMRVTYSNAGNHLETTITLQFKCEDMKQVFTFKTSRGEAVFEPCEAAKTKEKP